MMPLHLLHIKVLKDGPMLGAFVIRGRITGIALFGHTVQMNVTFTILQGLSNARLQIELF